MQVWRISNHATLDGETDNILINPVHPDSRRIRLIGSLPCKLDERLI